MSAKQVAMLEASMLKSFLSTIPLRDRRNFVHRVCERTQLTRDHWYNWLYAKSRIPVFAKSVIEREAHCRIFIGTEML